MKVKNFKPAKERMTELGMNPTDVMKEVSFALQLINTNNRLAKCTQESLLAAVVNIANIGLTLNPAARECYLVQRWNGTLKQSEACLQPSYIGLSKLIVQAGGATAILANVVHEGDFFELDLADNQKPIVHKPCLIKKDKGEIIGAYALATLQDGSRQPEWMDIHEVQRIRDYSDGWQAFLSKKIKTCPWHSDFSEMARKTTIRRIYKYLPRNDSKAQERADRAIELDNQEYKISFGQLTKIETLLQSANIEPERAVLIEGQMFNYTFHQAGECIEYLVQNQLTQDVRNGNAQSAAAINKSVAEALDDPKR